jgi:hypothetical protein
LAYTWSGSSVPVGAIVTVGAEPEGGGAGFGGFAAATVAALPMMSATATSAAT